MARKLPFAWMQIILVSSVVVAEPVFGQDKVRLPVSLGFSCDDSGVHAVRYAVEYFKNLHEIFVAGMMQPPSEKKSDRGWFFDASPSMEVRTAKKAAFRSIAAKLTGNIVLFKTCVEDDMLLPDLKRFHAFPSSIGIEADWKSENMKAKSWNDSLRSFLSLFEGISVAHFGFVSREGNHGMKSKEVNRAASIFS